MFEKVFGRMELDRNIQVITKLSFINICTEIVKLS